MIEVTVTYGDGDKIAPSVSDGLIISEAMATKRAEQELAAFLWVVKSSTLSTPHSPELDIGGLKEFAFSTLNIQGPHRVRSLSISLNGNEARDSVSIERYGAMLP